MNNLYITDLDGTLLNNEGMLSDESRRIIMALLQDDVMFTVASARSVWSIQRILKDIPLKLPVISFNGAYISDVHTCQHYKVNRIENLQFYEYLKENGVLISLHTDGLDALYRAGPLSEGAKLYIQDREEALDGRIERIEKIPDASDVMAFTVIDEKNKIRSVEKTLRDYDGIVVDAWEDMYYKPWYWLSVHSEIATKANGIKALKKIIGHTGKVVVFGDNTNDIEMFKFADVSIAVENAVPALKALADEIIGKNTENSVVKRISAMEAT